MTTIPADAVAQLREALYSELGNVAEEVDAIVVTSGRARDDWSPPVPRFDRARALLDELGWNERDPERDVEVDLDCHRQVIVEALSEALEGERYLMNEQGRHAGRQRRNSRARAATIEAFMTAAGLERA